MRRWDPSAAPAQTAGDVATDYDPSRDDSPAGQPASELFQPAPLNCRVIRQSDGGRGEFAGRLRSLPGDPPKPCNDTSRTDIVGGQELYRLVLLVAGNSGPSRKAAENLRHVCDEYLRGRVELRIIDIREQPEFARTYQVVAVPTLLMLAPEPRRIVGDLSDRQRVLDGLDLNGR
jgi:circadian clock protein KaiB